MVLEEIFSYREFPVSCCLHVPVVALYGDLHSLEGNTNVLLLCTPIPPSLYQSCVGLVVEGLGSLSIGADSGSTGCDDWGQQAHNVLNE